MRLTAFYHCNGIGIFFIVVALNIIVTSNALHLSTGERETDLQHFSCIKVLFLILEEIKGRDEKVSIYGKPGDLWHRHNNKNTVYHTFTGHNSMGQKQ